MLNNILSKCFIYSVIFLVQDTPHYNRPRTELHTYPNTVFDCLFVSVLDGGIDGIGILSNIIRLNNLPQKVIFESTLLFSFVDMDHLVVF